ncbi:Chromatin structure-remodeling complex protein rsc9 [Xylographa bjoerkii]|nr:Chromatin structure-remodeling complex protein rsc9 [Xylographa bjoerkii]
MAPARAMDDPMEGVIGSRLDQRDFFEDLKSYHAERGTSLDVNARVNGKHIDLYTLFGVVNKKGGYDVVSAEKLAWRKVGQDFHLGQTNTAAYAFALKTVYYKNLAQTYEIKRIHNQEPPPREILEDISAKGGDLLTRTLENFKPPQSRDHAGNGNDSDGSGEEDHKTPKEEKMDLDEPGSGGRVTRGLRQAPPQRQLFQPDISSSRQTRHTPSNVHSPQPLTQSTNNAYNYNPSSNPNSSSFSIANYEPRIQVPLTLRPVLTPGNNPAMFRERLKKIREAQAAKLGKTPPSYKGMMLPGTGFDGPNIYVRTLLALRSGIPGEQDYALHHLVKISHERGDKYKFEAFPGLAEGLIEKALEVGSLFYDVNWMISYSDDVSAREVNVLDGMNGTQDLLKRISGLRQICLHDEIETEEHNRKLSKINEAGLVIRNMSMLEDNAKYLSEQYPLRDFLTIALNLPRDIALVELKHYALDVAEQLTKYWSLDASDPLYLSLLKYLNDGLDRGATLTTLRAISRISMNLEDSNRLQGVPLSAIRLLCEWTLLDDEELVAACLDFFYQFTAMSENVAFLLTHTADGTLSLHPLISQLGRLLLHNSQESYSKRLVSQPVPVKPATEIPTLPNDLLEQIMKYSEPDRSSHWLRACFEEDPESDITQIALWQAYQARFTRLSTAQNPLLAAAEFIKNVSTTFPTANAQVISGVNPRFIIKGIRPRHVPMDTKGRVYSRCLWRSPEDGKTCGDFYLKPGDMWEHLITFHLGLSKNEESRWNILEVKTAAALNGQKFSCHWAGCQHFSANGGSDDPYEVGMHIKMHLPDISAMAGHRAKFNKPGAPDRSSSRVGNSKSDDSSEYVNLHGRPAVYDYFPWYNTAVDERGDAVGLPLTSVLVLKNLARNIPKAIIALGGVSDGFTDTTGKEVWMERLLGPIIPRLGFVLAHNRPLATYVSDLITAIENGIVG